jgi:hypothetical protein
MSRTSRERERGTAGNSTTVKLTCSLFLCYGLHIYRRYMYFFLDVHLYCENWERDCSLCHVNGRPIVIKQRLWEIVSNLLCQRKLRCVSVLRMLIYIFFTSGLHRDAIQSVFTSTSSIPWASSKEILDSKWEYRLLLKLKTNGNSAKLWNLHQKRTPQTTYK